MHTTTPEEWGNMFDEDVISLHHLGQAADAVRRQWHGNTTFYNVNVHVNPTNICKYACPLCAYHSDGMDARAFLLQEDEVLARIQAAARAGCTEVHLVSGAHPDLPYEWYRNLVAAIHRRFPTMHIKAWTAVEIANFADISGMSVRDVLRDMKEAGLCSMPGGGAEIFARSVRQQIAPDKADGQTWSDIHRIAHSLDIPTNATMLFGHVESFADRVHHLLALRELQEESLALGKASFGAFVPLVFHPSGTQLADNFAKIKRTSPTDVLRTIAISRLLLDNIPHIKAYWVSLGLGLAQTALSFGASDLDGTVREEKIHHLAGSETPQQLSVTEIRRLITEAGFTPIER